jgi:hypothetical protein
VGNGKQIIALGVVLSEVVLHFWAAYHPVVENDNPLAWWELGRTRTVVAISFLIGLVLVFLTFIPSINQVYESYPALKHLGELLIGVLGLSVALLELRHSEEANKHRDLRVKLAREANTLEAEKKQLYQQTLDLQREVHYLQQEIERKLTKVRLYVRVRNAASGLELSISNLSDFDLWINQARLIVTEAVGLTPGTHIIGDATRISRGLTENGYQLYGKLLSIHGNQPNRVDMKFYVQVEAEGVADKPITIDSPKYHFTFVQREGGGVRELRII